MIEPEHERPHDPLLQPSDVDMSDLDEDIVGLLTSPGDIAVRYYLLDL